MERSDLVWKQYELHVLLYKHYLDLTLKINGAYYAITGAVVSYVLAHPKDGPTRAALFVPLVLGIGLVVVSAYGAIMLRHTRAELIAIRNELKLQTIPELNVLTLLLCLSTLGFITVSIGVAVLWCEK